MPVIYKCPNCGAAMEFDSDTQKLGCKRCGTQIDVETYEKDSTASGEQREKVPYMKIYNCQSCGAQLVADEYTSATFCSYCGNPTLVEDRLQGEFKPQLIIPFKINKEQAVDIYRKWLKKGPLTPKELSTSSTIEKMKRCLCPILVI